MPSASLQRWRTARHRDLDEIIDAHRSIGGSGPGRRFATRQINHAYAVLLSSQFQGFCRDLHTESTIYLVQGIMPNSLKSACRSLFEQNRKLDQGNPTPGNIGSDYNRLGLNFWNEVKALDLRNQSRQNRLEELNQWRNAIAHQDFSKFQSGSALGLRHVREWRSACNQLAIAFDTAMLQHIQAVTGTTPW